MRRLWVFLTVLAVVWTGCEQPAGPPSNRPEKAATPTANPRAGKVGAGTRVALSTATPGAEIYYTITGDTGDNGDNGNTPDRTKTKYTEAITINGPVTVRAVAVKAGMEDSGVLEAAYELDANTAAAPAADPPAGEVALNTEVTLSTATAGAQIYYTIDGSAPDTGKTEYTVPVIIDSSMTIRAVAVMEGMKASAELEAVYTIAEAREKAARPSAAPPAGEVDSGTGVTLSTATAGAEIYYTIDGTAPDAGKTRYTGPIGITGAVTIKAAAVKVGTDPSEILEAAYTVAAPGTAARPSASPPAGELAEGAAVTLSTTTEGAEIFYTIDGTAPDRTKTKYAGPVVITGALTLRAAAVKAGMADSAALEAAYTVRAGMPVANPAGGTVAAGTAVTLSTATAGAEIYYTIDGSAPDRSKTKYTGPVGINGTVTLKAAAVKEGMTDSAVLEESYTVRVGTPAANPAGGTVAAGTGVTFSTATAGAEIFYTTNGDTPDRSKTKYTGPITINSAVTIKTIAVKDGLTDSAVLTTAYAVPKAETPMASPGAGEVAAGTAVTLSTATAGADIFYTTNGDAPDRSKKKYTGPVTITGGANTTLTIKAVVVKTGMADSGVLEAVYTIAAPDRVVQPSANPGAGEVAAGTAVTLSTTTDGASIYYTTNGDAPDRSKKRYTGPVTITGTANTTVTIKAVAVKTGMTDSLVLEAAYTVKAEPEPEPGPGPGTPPEEAQPQINGIEISRYPDTTYFALNQPFSHEGLELVFVYDNGDRGRKLSAGEYSVEVVSTATALSRRVTVTSDTAEGRFTARYGITIDSSTSVLMNIRMESPPNKTAYTLGENFSTAGMVVKGTYQGGDLHGQDRTLDAGAVATEGYAKYLRGAQQVTLKLNNAALGAVDVTVKVPPGAVIRPNSGEGYDWIQTSFYRPVRVKGEAFDLARSNLKATVLIGGAGFALTYENGGITEADLAGSGYNPLVTGIQTLTMDLDGNTVTFPLYVADAEPEVYFDYGWWRHDQDPRGAGPGEGVYYAKPNETLVLSPVRFLIGYDAENRDTGASYAWSVSGPSAYTRSVSSNGEFCYFTPQAAGTWTVTVDVSGRNFAGGGTITKTAATQVVCYTGTVAAPAGKSYQPLVKNFGPGQFSGGGTGLGWSLGSALGYEVWTLPDGAATLNIYGNAFWPWSEAGIVWVQYDANGNGFPDETWYELKGGEDEDAFSRALISRRHAISYYRGPDVPSGSWVFSVVYWVDKKGRSGRMYGWPSAFGVSDTEGTRVTYTGTMLRDTGDIAIPGYDDLPSVGYVDTAGGSAKFPGSVFNVARDAVKADGSPANLDPTLVRFVKVQTAFFRYGGTFGDVSTEIVKATGLADQSGGFPMPWD
jgi:transcription elongation GreA/GreB family factor